MLLNKVEYDITKMLNQLNNKLTFHSIYHTKYVVNTAKKICDYACLSKTEREIVIISAWFHDIGYLESYLDHEYYSVRIAENYLKEKQLDSDIINEITTCISATKTPQKPTTFLAKIVCDADLSHLGSTNYFYWLRLLRKEWKVYLNKTFNNYDWYTLNHRFLTTHVYHTSYGKDILSVNIKENVNKLEKLISSK
ncbi:HD domain-containing protein [Tenacibaculum sp. IB213877]|uniref:HD domain-containing protein n=1 Tax=Tenacibaculum sp. IB213877 TaxID=3097351 RepID=UPI002A5AC03E|nr:HD domain-containing protein [Tenacibaculum sp. IB213877]MDY0779359.1 HD domain-containing protein [Tenacibaculum sp. IB213877]